MFQDSLGGDGKTLMFMNVHPGATNVEETLSTLAFGQQVCFALSNIVSCTVIG